MVDVSVKTDQTRNATDGVYDREWVKSTFIIADKDIVQGTEYKKWIRKNRYHSSADYKFTSTTPGMNIAVNPKPQFTRYADIRSKGKLPGRPDVSLSGKGDPNGLGMGRYYSEAIDDNEQRIYLRFGVPKFMPLLLWITKSFDIDKTILQNRGVITTTFLEAVGVISTFFAVAAAQLLALGMFVATALSESSRFYSVKPTMYIYWSTVENMLNNMVARRTMLPGVFQDFTFKLDNKIGETQKPTSTYISELNTLLPDVIDAKTGRISVFALALKSQSAFNKMQKADYDKNANAKVSDEMTNKDFSGYPINEAGVHDTYFTNREGRASFFTKNLFDKAYNLLIKDDKTEQKNLDSKEGTQKSVVAYDPLYTDENGEILTLDPTSDIKVDQFLEDNAKKKKPTFDKYKEYLLAELSEGAAFAVFNVDSTGSVGESFSSSSGSNPIESTFNSLSAKSRNIGNMLESVASIPVIGDALKLAADTGATILSKSTFGLANPLLALAYGVNVSMPKIWESSSASLPRSSYKIKLISPYGNAYSQLFNIYLPLSMILAGSLPRSTGNSSYTSPFMCQLFDRGRSNIQLGMIETVSITRGTSNLGFSKSGHPNAIDIDLSIANMDEVISVDIASSGIISNIAAQISPKFADTPFISYLNSVMAVDVYTMIYRVPMMRLKLAERYMALKAIANPDPAAFAAFTVNKVPFSGLLQNILGNNQAAIQDVTNR